MRLQTCFSVTNLKQRALFFETLLAAIFGAIGGRLKVRIKIPYDSRGLTRKASLPLPG
jgi:hypothetical protein